MLPYLPAQLIMPSLRYHPDQMFHILVQACLTEKTILIWL